MPMHAAFYLSILSPTRLFATITRNKFLKKEDNGRFIVFWTYGWALASFVFVVVSAIIEIGIGDKVGATSYEVAAFFAISRSVEILYAFVTDSWGRLGASSMRSGLDAATRIKLALVSYIEVALNYAIIDYAGQMLCKKFKYQEAFTSIIDACYFSFVTITTTGYGDIAPKSDVARVLAVLEILTGIVLFVVALSTYMGTRNENQQA